MKSFLFPLSILLCVSASAGAATVQALFTAQTQGSSGGAVTGYSATVSANTFPVVPTLVKAGGASSGNQGNGGASSYTDFNGYTWTGDGGTASSGRSFNWISGAANNSITITLDMVGFQDLTIAIAIRSAADTGTVVSAFSAIEYSVNGSAFTAAATGSALNFPTAGSFGAFNLDLTSLAAIEDATSVQIRFSVPNIPANETGVQFNTSVRLDNVLLTAQTIPEPSAAVSVISALGLLGLLRRRSA
ncbi:MAG: hypothetical protein EOP87_04740 [Verrucomicrobiaceae bacterium]|nr:MAG: hypothetical protein EOP87_04740 [Verrucomicrobiaceae bacterium]